MERKIVPRVSIFLDHSDFAIFDIHGADRHLAHQLIIRGVSYISESYIDYFGRRKYDSIEDISQHKLKYKKADGQPVDPDFIYQEIVNRLRGKFFSDCVLVQLPSISITPYYAIYRIQERCSLIERGGTAFYARTNDPDVDPLSHELHETHYKDFNVDNSYYLPTCVSQMLDIPYARVCACHLAKNPEELNAVLATEKDRAILYTIFKPRTTEELYAETTEAVLAVFHIYLIPPLADIVWNYLI